MTKPWWKEPTRNQWITFIAAWMGWVLDAFDFVIFTLVGNEIAAEFHVPLLAVLGGSITLTLLVRMAGGFVAGWMADKWGRKLPLMLSLLWFAVFDFAIYFAPTFGTILVLRTLFGFGMGAEWTAGTAMAMENWPQKSRKIASGLLQLGWPVGYFLAAAVAHFVVPAFGWRAMFIVAAIPALLVVPIRFLVKEEPVAVAAQATAPKVSMRDLLDPKVLKMLIIGVLVVGLGFAAYYGMSISYKAMLVKQLGLSAEHAFDLVMVFNLGMACGVILAGSIAGRWGVVAALAGMALLMIPAMPLYVGMVHWALPIGAFLGGMLGAGYSGVTPVLTTSLFDERVRARAIGIVYHGGALLAAFVPTLVAYLGTRWNNFALAIGLVSSIALAGMSFAVYLARRVLVIREHAARGEGPTSGTGTSADDVVPTIGDEVMAPPPAKMQRTVEARA